MEYGDVRLPERFWRKVTIDPGGCWQWTAHRDKDGYGVIAWGSPARGHQSHRVAYGVLVGPIPEGFVVRHKGGRSPGCCNPDHLEAVTQKTNIARGGTGKAAASRQLSKTHCPQGHEYTEANTYVTALGSRTCRECSKLARKRSLIRRPRKPRKSAPYKKRIVGPGVGVCSFPGCDRPTRSSLEPLCQGHYTQRYRGFELKPLRNAMSSRKTAMGEAQVIDELGRKLCSQCLELKGVAEFPRSSACKTGLDYCCKPCRRTLYDIPEKQRARGLIRKYGITAAQYDDILAAQGGVCHVCKLPPREGTLLHVDHDHSCCPDWRKTCGSCIRGLLCFFCNTGLGYFDDNPERLLRAADHVSRRIDPNDPWTTA